MHDMQGGRIMSVMCDKKCHVAIRMALPDSG